MFTSEQGSQWAAAVGRVESHDDAGQAGSGTMTQAGCFAPLFSAPPDTSTHRITSQAPPSSAQAQWGCSDLGALLRRLDASLGFLTRVGTCLALAHLKPESVGHSDPRGHQWGQMLMQERCPFPSSRGTVVRLPLVRMSYRTELRLIRTGPLLPFSLSSVLWDHSCKQTTFLQA